MNKTLTEQELQAICDIMADTNNGLTKTQITDHLRQSSINAIDDGKRNNGMYYQIGMNKRTWLYNCFVAEIKKTNTFSKIYVFIEYALAPITHTDLSNRNQYNWLLEETNKVLLFLGLCVDRKGKISQVVKAETLSEVDRRVNDLSKKLYDRAIHQQVIKYCNKDLLRKDYFDAVFEAAKGLAERLREISGINVLDGGQLFDTAFSLGNPYVYINAMQTQSEKSEHTGLKELLQAIFHLFRNPPAHTPKINWRTDETRALDALTLISLAHKYLDECRRIPGK